MQLYDVGFTSHFVAEAEALAKLATIAEKPALVPMLEARASHFRSLIAQHLWDQESGAFVNRLRSGEFYRRVSPTSFYALGAGAATDAQAEAFVKGWLLNSSRFGITIDGDFAGNSDQNFWGLPSISADDPSFPKLGYWRGFVWGPTAQLVFWSLERYKHVAVVAQARLALAKQMTALMLTQWREKREICENFSPHKVTSCTGTKMYHWGALCGLLSMEANGLYNWTAAASPPLPPPPAEPWVTLGGYDCTAHCSGKNNTPTYGCRQGTPQLTQADCQRAADRANFSAYAFQTKGKPFPNKTKECWFQWGRDFVWKDPRDCPPPYVGRCKAPVYGDVSGCVKGKVRNCF